MVFIIDGKGNMLNAVPERVYQGSNLANGIILAGPIPSFTQVTLSATTPNGINLTERYMENGGRFDGDTPENTPWYYWTLDIDATLTEFAGDVILQFHCYNGSQIVATAAGKIIVEAGVPKEPPTVPEPDIYTKILQELSKLEAGLYTDYIKTDGTVPFDVSYDPKPTELNYPATVKTVLEYGAGSSSNFAPYVGEDGYWYEFDKTTGEFVNTNVKAQGPKGEQGVKGDKGDTGATGAQGPKGEIGPVGPAGPKGERGAPGPRGETGIQGIVGPQGPQGIQGPKGLQGIQGPIGQQGAQGDPGPQGPKGDKGDTGATGAQGPRGLKGDVGDTGPQGPRGLQGEVGPQGVEGPQGERGVQGPAGPQGVKGDTGPKGDKGEKGDQGIEGPQGPQGIQGIQGPQGLQGEQGPQGETGAQGPQGPQGPTGAAGNSALTVKQVVSLAVDPTTGASQLPLSFFNRNPVAGENFNFIWYNQTNEMTYEIAGTVNRTPTGDMVNYDIINYVRITGNSKGLQIQNGFIPQNPPAVGGTFSASVTDFPNGVEGGECIRVLFGHYKEDNPRNPIDSFSYVLAKVTSLTSTMITFTVVHIEEPTTPVFIPGYQEMSASGEPTEGSLLAFVGVMPSIVNRVPVIGDFMIINCAWNTKKYQVMGTVTQYTQSIGSLQLLVLSAIERAAAVEYTGPVYFNIERTQLESEDIGNINNTYDRNAYYAEIFPLISYEPGEVPENVIFIQFFSDSISCTEARIWSNGSRIYCTYKHFGSSGTFVYSSDNIDTVSISSSPNYSGFAINGYAFNI